LDKNNKYKNVYKYETLRISTERSRIPFDKNDNQDLSPGPGQYLDIYD
jgi:hypothetical protein